MMPRVFVGCASESRSIAYAIQQNLEYDANITVWTQGIFQLSYSTIESLLRTLKDQDFGIFILEPQDLLLLRGQEYQVPRDNVILEVGLFIGALGRERTFLVVPRSQEALHLPTDLLGMTPATFNADRSDLQGALGSACTKILQEIARLGPSDRRRTPLYRDVYTHLVVEQGLNGRIYEFGDRVKSNKASKRPLTQASLRCNRWLKPVSLQRVAPQLTVVTSTSARSGVAVSVKDVHAASVVPSETAAHETTAVRTSSSNGQ